MQIACKKVSSQIWSCNVMVKQSEWCRKPPDNVSVIQLKISERTNNHDSVEKKKGKSVMFLLGRFSCID